LLICRQLQQLPSSCLLPVRSLSDRKQPIGCRGP
jgi:hypothetical protein